MDFISVLGGRQRTWETDGIIHELTALLFQ